MLINKILPPKLSQLYYYRFQNNESGHKKNAELFKRARLKYSFVDMYDLVPGDVISGNIAFNGFYELKLTRDIVKLAKKGGVFVDVGANMGYFSLLWAGMNKKNKVYSIEASPRVQQLLENNIQKNQLAKQVTVYKLAAGEENGQIEFNIGSDIQTGWGGITQNKTINSFKVDMKRIDELIGDDVDVLKIDIEGADTLALLGAEKLIKAKKIKKIFFEQNKVRMKQLSIDVDEAKKFLKINKYSMRPYNVVKGEVVEWMAEPD